MSLRPISLSRVGHTWHPLIGSRNPVVFGPIPRTLAGARRRESLSNKKAKAKAKAYVAYKTNPDARQHLGAFSGCHNQDPTKVFVGMGASSSLSP